MAIKYTEVHRYKDDEGVWWVVMRSNRPSDMAASSRSPDLIRKHLGGSHQEIMSEEGLTALLKPPPPPPGSFEPAGVYERPLYKPVPGSRGLLGSWNR